MNQDVAGRVSLDSVPKGPDLARSVGHEKAENDNIGIPAFTSGIL